MKVNCSLETNCNIHKNPFCDQVIIIGCSFYINRNQFFRMLFGTMIVLGHIEFILDIVPLLYKFVPDENHVIIPMCLVFINLYFYHKCCMEDPGIITARTEDRYRGVYAYDGRMFKPGVSCVTCHLEKPARSKHCSKFSLLCYASIGISYKNLKHLKVLWLFFFSSKDTGRLNNEIITDICN